jgi:RNA-binding protein YhbY
MSIKKNTLLKTIDDVPMELPSDNKELANFIKINKVGLTEKTLSSIEYALKNNLSVVKVFVFNNSDFVVTISKKDFLSNVDHIYNFYLETEKYELCPRAIRLQKLLKILNDEKEIEATTEY